MIQSPQWKPRRQTDPIIWDPDSSTKELMKEFKIDNAIDPAVRRSVFSIIYDN